VETARSERNRPGIHSVTMSAKDFRLFSRLIEGICGIKMPDAKKNMLESRLRKRLRSLEIESFRDYYDYVSSPEGERAEMTMMIDAVTTNKTDFFREPAHFAFLTEKVMPDLLANMAPGQMRIWSAGCSSGEEPYTLAMVLSEYASTREYCNFSILATDICTEVLEKAYRGIYEEDRIAPIPADLRKKYLLRSRDRSRGVVRLAPEIRSKISFRRLNFLATSYGLEETFQVIFCRNVLIYFDRPTQERILNNFCRHLQPGGHLFLGHSETINGLDVPLVQVNSTIYRKPE
jgi:chemotaxis protein methyltransferase CheR